MELRQLRYFIAVAENLSFSKAAQQLHVTVPPLSRQIRQLEDEFEVRLFDRDRKHVALSDAGRLLLREAKALVTLAARVTDSVRMAKCGAVGLVRIGIGPALGERVSRVIMEHSIQCPAVEIQCRDIMSLQQYQALLEGEIDVAFLRPCTESSQVTSEYLFDEQMVVHISKSNPLSKRKSLRITDLADETLLLFERRSAPGLHDKTIEMYAAAGVIPNVMIVAADPAPHHDVQAVLVACRKGIRIRPDEVSCRPGPGSEIAVVPLDEPDATMPVHVVCRRGEKAPPVVAFVNTARNVLRAETRSALPIRERAVVAN